jgi:hypothetical protein
MKVDTPSKQYVPTLKSTGFLLGTNLDIFIYLKLTTHPLDSGEAKNK